MREHWASAWQESRHSPVRPRMLDCDCGFVSGYENMRTWPPRRGVNKRTRKGRPWDIIWICFGRI
ncbi:unnamed protein product [Chondrus crispus]|uniref:Uncharacterized protein n=1 Tax=Chondrus crispus TaxID=2769 RepID=R7QR34_CHOCR|nr:unnamed protein product [Chondrus crispus]CDF39936.1 unnamed protein product [Chondrus crispus]|eukprot:XP_005710230.1 unnamed protein product [Chondrus crispus]